MAMPAENIAWSQARIEQLVKLWGDGVTHSQIAAKLNQMPGSQLTRNAIIGKGNRMKLGDKSPPPRALTVAPKPTVAPEIWAIVDPVLRRDWPDDVPADTIHALLVTNNPGIDIPDENRIRVRAQALKLKRTNADKFRRDAVIKTRLAQKGDMVERVFFDRVEAGMMISTTTPPTVAAMLGFTALSDGIGVDILDLADNGCRLILGKTSAGHVRYCGARCGRRARGGFATWCDRHQFGMIDLKATAKRPAPLPDGGRGNLKTVFGSARLG